MNLTPYDLAQRFAGDVKEITGAAAEPAILWFLSSCNRDAKSDEIPWCSAFVNRIAWLCRLPRSKSLAARSWLQVGTPISLDAARPGFDVVIIKRGEGAQPGPEVLAAPGHVFFFAGLEGAFILGLGGNQSNAVNISRFPAASLLGVRRLA